MGLFADIIFLFTSGYGWIFMVLLLAYELFAPTWLNRDTALAPLVRDLPEDLQEVKEQQREARKDINDLSDEIAEVQRTNKVQMQVQRAQARANDDMDEQEVDSYLRKNGVTVDTFLQDNE